MLQVVKRFFRVRHDCFAHVVLHHPVSSVVNDGQGLQASIRVAIDLFLKIKESLAGLLESEVWLLKDVHVVEAVFCNLVFKGLHVVLHFLQVGETFLFWFCGVSVFVYSLFHEADRGIIVVAKDEALSSIRGEVGQVFILQFAEHFDCWWWRCVCLKVFCLVSFLLISLILASLNIH